jgi:monofunctional biosynthetic peptidoglycan transglycosylase
MSSLCRPTLTFAVRGMIDAECAARVQRALEKVPGVRSASVDPILAQAQIDSNENETVQFERLAEAVERAGFAAIAPEEAAAIAQLGPDGATEPRWRVVLMWLAIVGVILPALWVSLYSIVPVPGTLLMLGRTIEGQGWRYSWSSLDVISPNLVRAVIASEDQSFCGHAGFDFQEIDRAMKRKNGRWRGASTISQQTAKNAFLWPGRSWLRKAFEAYFTIGIEALWSKRRIMEVYLNIAEWGPGVYGAEAASQYWFKKSAKSLTVSEAARLAAILPSPLHYRANPPGRYVAGRAGSVGSEMAEVRNSGLDSCTRIRKTRP